MKSKTEIDWKQIKAAYMAGGGLRELARATGLSEGTVLARAHREKWTDEKLAARSLVESQRNPSPDVPQSVAITFAERGQRHLHRMAVVSEKVTGHLESLDPVAVLGSAREIETIDRVARRTFGLDVQEAANNTVNIAVGMLSDLDDVSFAKRGDRA